MKKSAGKSGMNSLTASKTVQLFSEGFGVTVAFFLVVAELFFVGIPTQCIPAPIAAEKHANPVSIVVIHIGGSERMSVSPTKNSMKKSEITDTANIAYSM